MAPTRKSSGRSGVRNAVGVSPLHDRMILAVGDRTFRHISEISKTHPETVRRYFNGQAPSAEFLTELCKGLGISGDWLLTGRGPMRADEVKQHALQTANTPELFSAMANTLDTLVKRVERLEVFVQALEVKIRARTRVFTGMNGALDGHANGSSADRTGSDRAGRVAGAVAQRPSQAAG